MIIIKKIDRTGEEKYNNEGLKITICEYVNCSNIKVVFEDGVIKKSNYGSFRKGNIMYPKNYKNRIGEISRNSYGSYMTIVEYTDNRNVLVEFNESGWRCTCSYVHFLNGEVKSPYCKTKCGVGYLGEGVYSPSTHKNIHKSWGGMIRSCYDELELNKNKTYKNAIVCDEWHNFQNFAKWYEENFYEIENKRMDLDKDILVKNNKIYSPETCIFVPHDINMLFVKSNKSRGNLPIGVSLIKNNNVYRARLMIEQKEVHLGCFTEKIDAFYAYKNTKENYIKQIADEYNDKIPKKLYDAMYKYEVEITD